MELDLQRTTLEGYQLILDTILTQEEVIESIVPDSYPDVSRIVCAAGEAFLTSKQVNSGSVKVLGTANIHVLYVPEGERSHRSITLNLPFQCVGDHPQIKEADLVHCSVLSVAADARMINPRKLFAKGEIKIVIKVYSKDSRDIACDISGDEGGVLQKLHSECTHHAVAAVLEKPFVFSDTLRQSASKPNMEELLYCQTVPGTIEARYIGKKLVCKGEMMLHALCRSGNETIHTSFELPYSQVLEFEGNFDEGEPDVAVVLKKAECNLNDGELEVSIEALIQATLWSQRKITLLRDLYSTVDSLDVERTGTTICVESERNSSREAARKFCESGIPANQVLNSRVFLSSLTAVPDRTGMEYGTMANVDILYLSEDNSMCSVHYMIPVSCNVEIPEGCICTCRCRPVGEVIAVPVTGGFEVRLEVDFAWRMTKNEDISCVTTVKKCHRARDTEQRPSVILRLVTSEESLWEIAKACRSTIHDICSANELNSESVVPGTILLIPTKR